MDMCQPPFLLHKWSPCLYLKFFSKPKKIKIKMTHAPGLFQQVRMVVLNLLIREERMLLLNTVKILCASELCSLNMCPRGLKEFIYHPI